MEIPHRFKDARMIPFDKDAQDSDTKFTASWPTTSYNSESPLAVRAPYCKEADQQFLRASLNGFIQDACAGSLSFFFFLNQDITLERGMPDLEHLRSTVSPAS